MLVRLLGAPPTGGTHLESNVDQGWGLQAVLKKVGAALKGLYSAKKYDQRDADLGFLIVKLGNRKLAYALNKEVGAAS